MSAISQNKSDADKAKIKKSLAKINVTNKSESIMKSLIDKLTASNVNISSLSDEVLAKFCEAEAKQQTTKKLGDAYLQSGAAKKLSTGEFAIYKNGKIIGICKNEVAYFSMIKKELSVQAAPQMEKITTNYAKIAKNMANIKNEEKKIKMTEKEKENAVKESARIRQELNTTTNAFVKLQSAALQAKKDLSEANARLEDRKIKLQELSILQGSRTDRQQDQLQNIMMQRAKMEQDKILHQQHMEHLSNLQKQQIENDNRNSKLSLQQQANLAKLQREQLAKIQAENLKSADNMRHSMESGLKDISSSLGKGFKGLNDNLSNVSKDITNGLGKIEDKMDEILKLLKDVEENKNLDKILDDYTEPCSAGFCWHQLPDGNFRCGGGSHYLYKSELMAAVKERRMAVEVTSYGGFFSSSQLGPCIGRGR